MEEKKDDAIAAVAVADDGAPQSRAAASASDGDNGSKLGVVSGNIAGASGQQQVLVHKKEEGEEGEEEAYSPDDLHANDGRILALLHEQEGASFTFKGIQRRLGMHQQSLSRALHRLAEMRLVEKSGIGYHLSRSGAEAVSKVGAGLPAQQRQQARGGREYFQLLQTYIPVNNVKAFELVRPLAGKWFRNLRWVGLIESGTGFTLQWSSDDGSFQINLRMISDYVVVETNARTDREKLQAMAGSYAIFEHITRALQDRLQRPANSLVLNNNYYFINN